MHEDIEQMNVEVMQNDKQPKNILNFQLNQLHQNIMYLKEFFQKNINEIFD